MSHRLIMGLEFDGEYDPRVRAELEQLVATLQTWQVNVPPNDVQYLVAAASDDLTAERVGTDTGTIRVDYSTPGQVKWHAIGQASGGAGYMLALGMARRVEDERRRMGPPGVAASSSSSSSSSTTAGGHLHGIQRLLADGTTTTYNLLDVAEYIESVWGYDPAIYALSSDRTQVVFDTPPWLGDQLVIEYVIASL